MPALAPEDLARLITDYGILTILAAIALMYGVYYVTRIAPEEKKYRRAQAEKQEAHQQLLFEQVALSRQALETSNMVIGQNSDEMRDNRASHQRIGERLGCVEEKLERHDVRAEEIAIGVERIRTKLGA